VAVVGADHQLGVVADALVLRADRDEVVDLALGDRREVADLPEAIGLRVVLEHRHRQRDDLGDRLGAVVVAHDPARDARGASARPRLVEHEDVRAALGQPPRDGQAVDPAADDDVRGHQLQG
jgi:hypothetical protein